MRSLYRILRALAMALRGHRGQKDKGGKPYWRHVARVAWIAYGLWPSAEVVIVALLHDYLEDVDPKAYPEILHKFGRGVASGVLDLTRKPTGSYADYIRWILTRSSGEAQAVKLADLLHNTQPGRMPRKSWASSMTTRDAASAGGYEYLDALEALTRQRVMRSWGAR